MKSVLCPIPVHAWQPRTIAPPPAPELSVIQARDAYLAYGLHRRAWCTKHRDTVAHQLGFWIGALPLAGWHDFPFLLPRAEILVDRLLAGMSAEWGSADSNETLTSPFAPRTSVKLKPLTVAAYGVALLAWLRWLVKRRLIAPELLADFQTLEWPQIIPGAKYRRHLAADEILRLLAVCAPERRLLYEVAIVTEYRAGQLRALTTDDLDRERRSLNLRAAQNKSRQASAQLLPERLAVRLAALAELLGPGRPLLDVPSKPARSLRADMKRAGLDWRDRGRGRVDFHALKGSGITLYRRAGADALELQAQAMHSDFRITKKHYLGDEEDARRRQLAEKVAAAIGAGNQPEPTLWD